MSSQDKAMSPNQLSGMAFFLKLLLPQPQSPTSLTQNRGLAKAIKQSQKLADATEAKEKKRIVENKEGFARIIDHVAGYRDPISPPYRDTYGDVDNTLDVNAREGQKWSFSQKVELG